MEFSKEMNKFSFGFSSEKIAGTGYGVKKYTDITIDAGTLMKSENSAYKGIGCISGNNSSRLLLDYKALHPEIYEEILRLLFEKGYGAELSHIKLEFGADINSSSGTEPATMRYADEKPDVTRGAGFIFAADALKINPELTIDLLRWGEPGWVKNAFEISREEGFKARYKWYVNTIDEAYNKLGIRFTHISPDANETGDADSEWIIYFAEHLKAEQDKPYDYSRIKIVASDEVGTRTIADKMLADERLRNCVDIIGLHYTTYGDENTERLFNEFGKEIWYSEGIAPSNVSRLSFKKDISGLSGRNSAVDMANRIINGWSHGRMTMYEFQPAVSAYYDGSCYYPKHIIKANEPWSGHYEIGSGFYAAMHFTRFVRENWHPVQSACYGDGDENHYIENTTANYMTLMSEDAADFTTILTNDSDATRHYRLTLENCDFSGKYISFIETAPPGLDGMYNSGWFRLIQVDKITDNSFTVSVRPHSILTVTTLSAPFAAGTETVRKLSPERKRLSLPYRDSFSYESQGESFLAGRGGAPLFTTDQGGAFEVVRKDGKNYLEQQITADIMPKNWRFRGTPEPITCLGDDSWANYSASIKVTLCGDDAENYAGLGVRYNSAVACEVTSNCGFAAKIYSSGKWELLFMDDVVGTGSLDGFDSEAEHDLMITASGSIYTAYLDGAELGSYREQGVFQPNGRISLLSGYHKNRFAELEVKPIASVPAYADACDALEPEMRYFGNPELRAMETYKYSNRTNAVLRADSGFELGYNGSGFALCGTAEHAVIRIELDGKVIAANKKIGGSEYRQAFCRCDLYVNAKHKLKVIVLEGEIILDSVIVYTDSQKYGEFFDFNEKTADDKKMLTPAKAAAAAAVGAAALLVLRKVKKKNKR
ncbi:MAG: glycosyl hydrolase family 59 [Ruminococcus sp.]|nr:glycosyl hydrolase family 59 [Ruminococcus sp.]